MTDGRNVGGCPCRYTEPCREECSCAHSMMSGGCDRCCTYGSLEQRMAQAKHLSEINIKMEKRRNMNVQYNNSTRKIVINICYGGFSLSPNAVARLAELQGRECYFFTSPLGDKERRQINIEEAKKEWIWSAFDIPNLPISSEDNWHELSLEKKQEINNFYEKHEISNRDMERDDPLLVRVVEELGDIANGSHAQLKVVEIPNDVEWVVEEYDGREWIAETHRTWS
jgi:hypothetical protein